MTAMASPAPFLSRARVTGGSVDMAMAVLALVALPLDLPAAQIIRAPVALLLLAYIAWRAGPTLARVMDAPWILAIPVVCGLSALWAAEPGAALRHGGLILFAMIAAAALSTRLDLGRLLVAVLLSQALLAVASLITMTTVWVGGADGGYALIGVFPHKNVAGLRMVFLMFAALMVLVVPGFPAWARAVALASVPMAAFIIFRSVSATAQVLILGGVPLALFLTVAWRLASAVRMGRLALIWASLTAVALGAVLAANLSGGDPLGEALDAFGKDRTLTGRTELWSVAEEVMDDAPALGVGAGNYWQADNGRATSLASRFGGRAAENFSFHNLMIEVRVHLGWLGALIVLPAYVGAAMVMIRAWARRQTPLAAGFLLFGSVFVLRAFFESELFRPLTFTSVLFWLFGYVAIAALRPPAGSGSSPSGAGRLAQG